MSIDILYVSGMTTIRCKWLIAFVALLALSASTSSAQASSVTTGLYPAIVTGEQEGEFNFFEMGGGKVECEAGKFSGTMSEATSQLSLNIAYSGCKTSFETAATFDSNGCTFGIHPENEAIGSKGDVYLASAAIVCPKEKQMVLTMGLCNVDIPPQTELLQFFYLTNNTGSPRDITLETWSGGTPILLNVTNVFLCPLVGGSQSGTFKTKITVKAYRDEFGGTVEGSQVDTWID